MTESSTRRKQLADAAIEMLAAEGMRRLTHRAVDQRAGLAEGSCSYYFRTRQALLQAAVERLAEADIADAAALPTTGTTSAEKLADTAVAYLEHWGAQGRVRTLARHELALEATRRPELRAVLKAAAGHVRRPVVDLLAAAGVPEPEQRAKILIASLDGLLFERLAGPDGLDLDPAELRTKLLSLLRTFID
ncbi:MULTISPECIES: TetR family transcriptional regulator [unclassified Streptomyces]|uniref:TetR/AcrR family transcriptional regulator n=1 Tax=unclassified Streptomyces TaxID=2593676 RepID=UPI002E77E4C4|nr:TetR family transcriptional regulator [Streptomyces sp. JV185]MEE1769652.1 TetR family transcriptional regulator [Streptomyces sp. JV185]